MSLTLYLAVGLATLSALHIASANTAFQSKSKRTILGAGSGSLSYGILEEWTSAMSLIDASTQGDLGIYGLIFASGFFVLLGVWGWNLFTTRKFLVR
jgi:hypothetical protein